MIRFVVICLRERVHYASPYERHTRQIREDMYSNSFLLGDTTLSNFTCIIIAEKVSSYDLHTRCQKNLLHYFWSALARELLLAVRYFAFLLN